MRPTWLVATVLAGTACASLSGCDYQGLNSLTLPGTKGTGSDALTVAVHISDAQGLVPNSPVLVGDLNVGTVRAISLDGDTPVLTLTIEPGERLPANVVARIGQTSLLGAKHVELDPPVGEAPVGRLVDGAVIDEDHAEAYPSTEEVLAGVSALLNGGGLGHLRTITTEVNDMLGGREGDVRALLRNTQRLAAGLDAQKNQIAGAIDSMASLARRTRHGNTAVAEVLRDLPPALRVVRNERVRLVTALESLGRLGTLVQHFVREGGGRSLVRNVRALRPTLKGLADAGNSLTGSLWVMGSIFFPLQHMGEYFRGDDVNLYATVDARLANLAHGLLAGTPLDNLLSAPNVLLGQPIGASNDAADPLAAPTAPEPTGAGNRPPGHAQGTAGSGTESALGDLVSSLIGGRR